MKKLIYILTCLIFMTSCATTKIKEPSNSEAQELQKKIRQEDVRQAIEARRFLLKFNRLYVLHGGTIDLKPASNYIILDGDWVIINAAYMGVQYSSRPIAGIDMKGKAVASVFKYNSSKGFYEIRIKVKNEQTQFDVFLTIDMDGDCDASITSHKIDRVRYTGNFIPLRPKETNNSQENILL
jgi:hypothetical protein